MLSWRRVFIATPLIALLLGLCGVGYYIYIGDIDPFCEIGSDGTGLIPLGELKYGLNVGCNPRPLGIAFGSTYFGTLLYLPILLFLSSTRALFLLRKHIQTAPQSEAKHLANIPQTIDELATSNGREGKWTRVFIATPVLSLFLGLFGSIYFNITAERSRLCILKYDGSGIVTLREELYGPNASCTPDFIAIAIHGAGFFGILYLPVLLALSTILFLSIVISHKRKQSRETPVS